MIDRVEEIYKNLNNLLTEQEFTKLMNFSINKYVPIDEYKSTIINRINTMHGHEDDVGYYKSNLIALKEIFGLGYDVKLNQDDGVTCESYKDLFSHIVNNVLSDNTIKWFWFCIDQKNLNIVLSLLKVGMKVMGIEE